MHDKLLLLTTLTFRLLSTAYELLDTAIPALDGTPTTGICDDFAGVEANSGGDFDNGGIDNNEGDDKGNDAAVVADEADNPIVVVPVSFTEAEESLGCSCGWLVLLLPVILHSLRVAALPPPGLTSHTESTVTPLAAFPFLGFATFFACNFVGVGGGCRKLSASSSSSTKSYISDEEFPVELAEILLTLNMTPSANFTASIVFDFLVRLLSTLGILLLVGSVFRLRCTSRFTVLSRFIFLSSSFTWQMFSNCSPGF